MKVWNLPILTALCLACAGLPSSSAPESNMADEPDERDREIPPAFQTKIFGNTLTKKFEVIDADLDQSVVAVRLQYTHDGDVFRDAEGKTPRCKYPGLGEGEGVKLYLVGVGSSSQIEEWTIYASPEQGDSCTTEEEARRALGEAKAAMMAAGLDPSLRIDVHTPVEPLIEPRNVSRPWEDIVRTVPLGDDHTMKVVMSHDSDAGSHTYVAQVSVDDAPVGAHTHAPNSSQGGGGDLEVFGVIRQDDRAMLILEESWGPVGRWDQWVFSPVFAL